MLPMTAPTTRDLRALPKAHLHLHLEGAMRPSTLAELADRAGIAVPEIRGYGSFTAFADRSNTTHRWPPFRVLRTMFAPILPRPIIPNCIDRSFADAII